MKRITTILLTLVLLLVSATACFAQSAVVQKNLSVKISAGTKSVKAVYVNLNDWEIRPVMAKNTVGATESLADMAKRSGAEAAINGTYFASYTDQQPQGTVQIDSNFAHMGNNGTTMGVTFDNKIQFENLFVGIEGSINDSFEWPFNWYAWNINHYYTDPNAIVIFTRAKGPSAGTKTATSIVIKAGVVTEIKKGIVNIPTDGYVITVNSGANAQQIAKRFKIGDRVNYRYTYKQGNKNGSVVNWANIRHALGAGPRLLTNGKITVDFKKEGLSDPKITTYVGTRSFVGVDRNGQFVMGTVPSVTVKQLAEVMQKMGLFNAMNLDGNASTGLYYKGKYTTTPGRLLSNSLVVVKRTTIAKKPVPLEDAVNLYNAGKTAETKGDKAGAKEKYLAAIAVYPNLTDAHLKLAQLFDKEGAFEEAVKEFEKVISLNPRNLTPYETVAWLYYNQRKYNDAISVFQRLEGADPSAAAKANYGIGVCYSAWDMKKYDLARTYLQKAVDADPNGPTGQLARQQLANLPK